MIIQSDIFLAPYTTFKIGGPAKYFCEAKNVGEIKEAILWAKGKNLPYFVLGGGSNLLVSDKGFGGLVIKLKTTYCKIINNKLIAEAGVPLAKIVAESVNAGLSGLEWAVGIPGTIGGGVCGNCGAYGHSISETVARVKATDSSGGIIDFSKEECHFCYRGSIFSARGGSLGRENDKGLVILEVEFTLADAGANSGKEEIRKILSERKSKIPPFPSAGSFFKNYKIKGNQEDEPLFQKFPELKEKPRGGKIAMAYFIEQCGLKGAKFGGAEISEMHANFIVNTGDAKASDVLELVKICKAKVKEKFGIEMEEEKIFLGFD